MQAQVVEIRVNVVGSALWQAPVQAVLRFAGEASCACWRRCGLRRYLRCSASAGYNCGGSATAGYRKDAGCFGDGRSSERPYTSARAGFE